MKKTAQPARPSLSSDLKALLGDTTSTADVVFLVGKTKGNAAAPAPAELLEAEEMHAHSVIVCARSSVLRTMLCGGFKEGQPQRSPTIATTSTTSKEETSSTTLTPSVPLLASKASTRWRVRINSEPRLFRQILHFIYTDTVEWHRLGPAAADAASEDDGKAAINIEDALALCQEADHYDLAGMPAQLGKRLRAGRISNGDVLVLWDFAMTTQIARCRSELVPLCRRQIRMRAGRLFVHERWVTLGLSSVKAILKDKRLTGEATSEIQVFEALHRWYKAFYDREVKSATAMQLAAMTTTTMEEGDEEKRSDGKKRRRIEADESEDEGCHLRQARQSADAALKELLPLIDFRLINARDITRKVVPTGLVTDSAQLLDIYAFATTHSIVRVLETPCDGAKPAPPDASLFCPGWSIEVTESSETYNEDEYELSITWKGKADLPIGGMRVVLVQCRRTTTHEITVPAGVVAQHHSVCIAKAIRLDDSLPFTLLVSFEA